MAEKVTRIPKCGFCRKNVRVWTAQPLGPEDHTIFTTPGNHYRGFPAIGCCDECKHDIEHGWPVTFRYKGQTVEICRI